MHSCLACGQPAMADYCDSCFYRQREGAYWRASAVGGVAGVMVVALAALVGHPFSVFEGLFLVSMFAGIPVAMLGIRDAASRMA